VKIVRTITQEHPRVDKGWVREGILSQLSAQPGTLTEIARTLGISKSTASYHLNLLLTRGIIESITSDAGKAGASSKRYALKEGVLVTFPSRRDEEAELGRLRETFDLYTLSWESIAGPIVLEQVQGLLYKMYLHMFRIARSEHRILMKDYGNRAGAKVAKRMPPLPFKQVLLGLTSYLTANRISDADFLELPNSTISVIVSNACIGSPFHQSNSCYFLEGMIEGVVKTKQGPGINVGRVVVPGISSCLIAVGRVKRLDLEWISEAILSSPKHSTIDRSKEEI
jgi:DNA-binding transcriptional ArsR family regulator